MSAISRNKTRAGHRAHKEKGAPPLAIPAEPVSPRQAAAPLPEPDAASPVSEPAATLQAPRGRLKTLIAGWLLVVFCCVIWQPFGLGFYMDDWVGLVDGARHGGAFSAERLRFMVSADASRPAAGSVRFIFSSLLADRPMAWQAALLALNICIAAGLARLIRSLSGEEGGSTDAVSYAVGACWLVLPWSAGFRFWPILLPAHVLLIGFVLLVAWIVKSWGAGRGPVVVPGLGYLVCCLGYEAFYFQFLTVAALGLAVAATGRTRWKNVVRTALAMAVAQGLAAAWWRMAQDVASVHRGISPNWSIVLSKNVKNLVPEMLAAFDEAGKPFAICVIVLIGLLAVSVWSSLRASRKAAVLTVIVAAACGLGMFVSVLAFSLGERRIMGIGVETRSLTVVSFWLVCAAGVCAVHLRRHTRGVWRKLLAAAGIGAGLCLAVAEVGRGQDWTRGWDLQQKYLAEAPVEQIAKTEADALVLTVAPTNFQGAPVFVGYDLSQAMPITHPAVGRRQFLAFNPWLGPLAWDGTQLAHPGVVLEARAKTLYVWVPEWRVFFKAAKPFRVNQDRSIVPVP